MKLILNSLFLIVLISSSSVGQAQQLYFPPLSQNDWAKTTPESLGWCEDKVDTLYNFLEDNNTKAFLVLKDGKIVLEKYFGSFTSDSLWYWASAGKTLTGLLTGIAQFEGFLSVDTAVSTYLGQGWTSCPAVKESSIKVKHQLTMNTGLDDMASDPDCTSPECLIYLADAGTRWAYHNAPYTILDQVISAATGINFNTYFNSRIRNKTGMNGFWLNIDYNHIYFSTARSMARFGLLLLAKGNWNGDPVLADTSYFSSMINSSQELNLSYGYLTWLNGKESFMLPYSQFVFQGPICPDAPSDMYSAMGKNGQLINVAHGQGLVVVRMGEAPDEQNEIPNIFNNLIWKYLNNVICNAQGNSEIIKPGDDFSLYPNPVSDEINIIPRDFSKKYFVCLYDSFGYLKVISANRKVLKVSHLPAGLYILIIEQNGIRTQSKISIIR